MMIAYLALFILLTRNLDELYNLGINRPKIILTLVCRFFLS